MPVFSEKIPRRGTAFTKLLGVLVLALAGWRYKGGLPDTNKFIGIVAPHSTNWDFIIAICVAFSLGVRISIMAKDSLLRGPWGALFRWLGAIPVDRSRRHGMVDQMVDIINSREKIIIMFAPEGTRKKVPKWKSGFYHIAHAAKLPIKLCYINYTKKEIGLGKMITPTGDLEADMEMMKSYYREQELVV